MWGTAEAYGVARQSTGAYVTTGYGRRAACGQVNVLSASATPPPASSTPTCGRRRHLREDLTCHNDRGRNIIALPDDRLLIAGSADAHDRATSTACS